MEEFKMKNWMNADVVELNLSETAAGGSKPSVHDGNIYEIKSTDGSTVAVEEYEPETKHS